MNRQEWRAKSTNQRLRNRPPVVVVAAVVAVVAVVAVIAAVAVVAVVAVVAAVVIVTEMLASSQSLPLLDGCF